MDEEVFNIQLRKFLKKVGIQSQREIEKAIRDGIAQGSLEGVETLKASARLQVLGVDLDVTIEDDIKLAGAESRARYRGTCERHSHPPYRDHSCYGLPG